MSKTPLVFPLINMAVFGVGLPIFFLMIYGIGTILRSSIFAVKERLDLIVLVVWMMCFFLYQGSQFVSTMRYFLFLYPFLAIFAAMGVIELAKRVGKVMKLSKVTKIFALTGVLVVCSLWTLMFMSVYVQKNSRVRASEWIYQVVPDKSELALEHWDDPLPLLIPGINPEEKSITGLQLPVFYEDTDEKWDEMRMIWDQADYYVLTSNRGWGSITAIPDKFPRMSAYYDQLFAGETEFEKIAEFHSYPSLNYLGIPLTINDDWAEEAFTVYDHPKVLIYAKKN